MVKDHTFALFKFWDPSLKLLLLFLLFLLLLLLQLNLYTTLTFCSTHDVLSDSQHFVGLLTICLISDIIFDSWHFVQHLTFYVTPDILSHSWNFGWSSTLSIYRRTMFITKQNLALWIEEFRLKITSTFMYFLVGTNAIITHHECNMLERTLNTTLHKVYKSEFVSVKSARIQIGKSAKFEGDKLCKSVNLAIKLQGSNYGFVMLKKKPRRPENKKAWHQLPPCWSGAQWYAKFSLPMMACGCSRGTCLLTWGEPIVVTVVLGWLLCWLLVLSICYFTVLQCFIMRLSNLTTQRFKPFIWI